MIIKYFIGESSTLIKQVGVEFFEFGYNKKIKIDKPENIKKIQKARFFCILSDIYRASPREQWTYQGLTYKNLSNFNNKGVNSEDIQIINLPVYEYGYRILYHNGCLYKAMLKNTRSRVFMQNIKTGKQKWTHIKNTCPVICLETNKLI